MPRRKTPKPDDAARESLLARYAHIADSITTLFFPYAEVVIHDLSDQTIAYLSNNLSKREIGDDSALEDVEETARERLVGPYEKLNWDGRRMRCVSTARASTSATTWVTYAGHARRAPWPWPWRPVPATRRSCARRARTWSSRT